MSLSHDEKEGRRGSDPLGTSTFDASAVASSVGSRTPTIIGDIRSIPRQKSSSNDAPIDIQRAKEEFAALDRSLTKMSHGARSDIEKGASDDEFDLREYFTSSNEANIAQGIRHKHVGVTWSDLHVEVPDIGSKYFVRSLPHVIYDTLSYPIMKPLGMIMSRFRPPMPSRPILQNFDGVLKPGEMCLVLGVPGSGCSTFLKVIANERGDYANVDGVVEYAGIGHEEMSNVFSGEVVYNKEDDVHIPTLTVEQTLEFALAMKTPSKRSRLPGITGEAFNEEVLNMLLKMLNITHTKNTLVGNEFVRGVSGGERKRVSILEMMATRAHVVSYDNSTRGLDASTALDFVKSLRVTTDILGQTTFLSLYQAGENIYRLVDKVLVIDHGRTVYFGPAKEARQYFLDLGFRDMPRQATADYLTACTDPNERRASLGASPPDSPEALEAAFRSSKYFNRMREERAAYQQSLSDNGLEDQHHFRRAVLDAKKKDAPKRNPYTLGFLSQVKVLTKRQFRLQLQDKFTLYTSFGISWTLAIVLGATFLNLPTTTSGGFTRGSIMFLAMLMNCLDAFAEMPTQMVGRPIFLKQTSYKLFRPAALSFANTLADLPFSAVRVFGFNIIVYFMCGLYRSAGAFFTFHIFIYIAFLCMQGFFRSIGVVMSNFDSAFRFAALIVPALISYAGYLIPVNSMRRYIFWIYYINPMSYSFGGLMSNEFGRLNLQCDGNYITPRNPPGQSIYPNSLGPNQVCTFFGAKPGDPVVRGTDYLSVGYSLNAGDLWKLDFIVLIVLFVFFQVTQMMAMETVNLRDGGGAGIFIKEDKETNQLNQALRERAANPDRKERENEFKRGKTLTWKDVNYTVPVPGGSRRLLHDVTGYVKSGQLVALMGASGAGKTTVLDVLAQRKNIGVITGEVLLEGKSLSTSFARETAYAEQMDVHEPTSTVREALRFSAYLRQPFSIPNSEKNEYVESVIELLELQELSEALVMTLSVEARKRLTIGVELASRPSALLFLDEPTSGLDAQSAFNVVRILRKLAAAGQSIICTIHQPSALLFENFDRLLLLESGGDTVYFGDIGPDSSVLRDYLTRNNAACPPDANPAEFMLEVIGAGSTKRVGPRDWKDIWHDSPEFSEMVTELERLKADGVVRADEDTTKPTTYATPLLYQLQLVSKRALYALWRSPDYTWTRIFVHVFISLAVSLTFLRLGNAVRDLQFRVFAVFWVSVLPAIVVNQIIPAFIINRMIFIREASSGMYSPIVFAIGQLLAETPWSIACAVLYWVLMYFPMNFGHGAVGMAGSGYFLLMIIAVELFGVSMAQAIGALAPTIKVAVLTNTPISLILTTFAGVTIPYPVLAKFWKSWLYQLSPFTRLISGLISTELKGLEIRCHDDEFAVFNPPSGQTCGQWAGPFVNAFGGYLQDPDATSGCHYCQYKVGDEFFTPLNITFDTRWRDVGIIFAFFGFNIIVTIVASRYLRYAKR